MTRRIVYGAALAVFIAATAMTLSSILLPNWASYYAKSPDSLSTITKTLGLHAACVAKPLANPLAKNPPEYQDPSKTQLVCHDFPTYEDCHREDRYFCSMWRSVGWMMNVAAVMELVTLIAFVVILMGGKQKREGGWRVLGFLLGIVGVLQCAGMAIVAYLFDNDSERFFPGWSLDKSFYLCTASWSIAVLTAAGISISAFVFPPEDGYELIPGERQALD